jgi:hypothetical protein
MTSVWSADVFQRRESGNMRRNLHGVTGPRVKGEEMLLMERLLPPGQSHKHYLGEIWKRI